MEYISCFHAVLYTYKAVHFFLMDEKLNNMKNECYSFINHWSLEDPQGEDHDPS